MRKVEVGKIGERYSRVVRRQYKKYSGVEVGRGGGGGGEDQDRKPR